MQDTFTTAQTKLGRTKPSTGPRVGYSCLRVWGPKYFLRRQYFCFYYMFKIIFSGHNKIWRGKNIKTWIGGGFGRWNRSTLRTSAAVQWKSGQITPYCCRCSRSGCLHTRSSGILKQGAARSLYSGVITVVWVCEELNVITRLSASRVPEIEALNEANCGNTTRTGHVGNKLVVVVSRMAELQAFNFILLKFLQTTDQKPKCYKSCKAAKVRNHKIFLLLILLQLLTTTYCFLLGQYVDQSVPSFAFIYKLVNFQLHLARVINRLFSGSNLHFTSK